VLHAVPASSCNSGSRQVQSGAVWVAPAATFAAALCLRSVAGRRVDLGRCSSRLLPACCPAFILGSSPLAAATHALANAAAAAAAAAAAELQVALC
jgi:hypothetical protein